MKGRSRALKTGLMVTTWVFVGIFTAIIGATLIDLTEIADCDYEAIGQVLIGLNLAIAAGSIAAGIMCSRYSRDLDLIMGTFLVSLSLSSAALPWCPALGLMSTVMVIQGVSRGVITCCGNVMIVDMWKEKTAAPLHAMHFGTGFGSLIAPLMVEPFLSTHNNSPGTTDLRRSNVTVYVNHSEHGNISMLIPGEVMKPLEASTAGLVGFHSPSRIYIPYGIMAGFGMLCALAFIAFFFGLMKGKNTAEDNKEKDSKEMHTKNNTKVKKMIFTCMGGCANGDAAFGLQMSALLFFFYACVVGMSMSCPTYLLPVSVNGKLHFSKQQATYLTSAFWGSFAGGRLVSAPLAKCIPVRSMFTFELLAALLFACLLSFNGFAGVLNLWAYICAFAFVSSPIFPSGIAWTARYMTVTGPLMAVIQSGVGFGAFIASWLGGYGVQHFGPAFPLQLNFGFALGAAVLYALMQARASVHGEKLPKYKDIESRENEPPALDTYI